MLLTIFISVQFQQPQRPLSPPAPPAQINPGYLPPSGGGGGGGGDHVRFENSFHTFISDYL